jgi:hypothetical protein
MYESSLFSDPVFLVTWQVHLAVVILFSLFGVWWGASHQPWYRGPLLLCLGLWLFIPIKAAEPVIVLLVYVPLLALGTRLCQRWTKAEEPATPVAAKPMWRFALADLLWLTLLVGLLTALLIQCWRLPWTMQWLDALISGICFLAVGLVSLVAVRQLRLKWRIACCAMALLLVVAAAGVHYFFVTQDWLLLRDWALISASFDLIRILFRKDNPARPDIFLIELASFFQFSLFVQLAMPLVAPRTASSSRRLFWGLRIAVGLMLVCLLAITARAYAGILARPTWPAEQWPERNDREALRSILERHEQLNPRKPPYPEEDPAGRSYPQSITDLFDELEELTEHGQFTMFDSRTDSATFDLPLAEMHYPRSLAAALIAQAKADWAEGRTDKALQGDLLCIKLGVVLQQRGVLIHNLVGLGIEGFGLRRPTELRAELTDRQSRRLESFLADLAARREPAELLMQRELVYDEQSRRWRGRLTGAVRRLLGEDELENRAAILGALNRRDMLVGLLRTDLALRRFRRTHDRWPARLEELVPGQLPALPLDPWSQQPLVYRTTANGFRLYSVGRNGIDDGGDVTGSFSDHKDFDLDSWIRD